MRKKKSAFDCTTAKYIRNIVLKEWWSQTGDPGGLAPTFFSKGSETLEVAKRTLNDITTSHIWKYRCNILYDGNKKVTLAVATAKTSGWISLQSQAQSH
jgi:hypothetical protein